MEIGKLYISRSLKNKKIKKIHWRMEERVHTWMANWFIGLWDCYMVGGKRKEK